MKKPNIRSSKDVALGTALDLFAGAGGFTCGARAAGIRVVQAIEFNRHAARTYARNNPEIDLLLGDVRALDPLACLARVGFKPGEIDFILAGPPCQGFSESNRRTRTLDNPKNHLYTEVFRYAAALRPKCMVIENVAGLRTLGRGTILRAIIEKCHDLGYEVEWKILCAADYGVPQFRNRLFIVACDKSLTGLLPKGIGEPNPECAYVCVRDAIDDLAVLRNGAAADCLPYRRKEDLSAYQRLMRAGRQHSGVVQGNLVTRNAELIVERYRHIRRGCNWEAIPQRLLKNYKDVSQCHTGIYHRLEWHLPSKVLGNFRKNMLIHPSQNRGLSVREAARLQSFPDWYEFVGSIGFQQQQVADAVPPLLARRVIEHVKSHYAGATRQKATEHRSVVNA
jgi:DNA (cytosine-5)-methyltransferase 1